jgi:multiple sugar transport system ATP-binding protein
LVEILLDNVTKIFKSGKKTTTAVKNLTLRVPDKTFLGLLGPSGCGKTTTLRIMAGLEKPTSGRVYFDGVDVTAMDASKRNVAMIFQFPALYPTLSVYDNIAIALRTKLSPGEIRKEVLGVAEFIGISDYLKTNVSKLDVNLRQKVAIAKVLVRDPSVFILDEPLTVVEPKVRNELRSKLKEIQLKLGKSMIYVSHDQTEVLTLADKVAVMNNGEILQYDTPENLYNKPRDTFVAWFIGYPSMNFIECEPIRKGDRLYLSTASGSMYDVSHIPDVEKLLEGHKKLVLGIRPEHIFVAREGVKAKCVKVERFGSMKIFHLEVDGTTIKAKMQSINLTVGDTVQIDFHRDKIILFDAESGKSLF